MIVDQDQPKTQQPATTTTIEAARRLLEDFRAHRNTASPDVSATDAFEARMRTCLADLLPEAIRITENTPRDCVEWSIRQGNIDHAKGTVSGSRDALLPSGPRAWTTSYSLSLVVEIIDPRPAPDRTSGP